MSSTLAASKYWFLQMGRGEQILFLEWVKKGNEFLWDYSTMPESLRKFHSDGPREK